MKKNNMTLSDMKKIETLMQRGFIAKEIGGFLNRSESCAQNYMNIINDINEGKPIHLHSKIYSHRVVSEYCAERGIDSPQECYEQEEQTEIPINYLSGLDSLAFVTVSNMLNDVSLALESVAANIKITAKFLSDTFGGVEK